MTTMDAETRFKKTGRNDDCPCGSGKKYKKCHLMEDESAVSAALSARNAQAAEAAADGHVHGPDCDHEEDASKPKFEAPKVAMAGPKQAKVAKAVVTPRKAV
jgi:hypothetical protein